MFTRKFTLRDTVKVNSEPVGRNTPVETHFGVKWSIGVRKRKRIEKNGELCFESYLTYFGPGYMNPWSVSVKGTCRIENGNETDKIERTFEETCNENSDHFEIGYLCDWDTLMEKYVENDKVNVEIDIIITEIKGIIPKRKLHFDAPEENMTDVVLIVGDQKFNVLKGMLARFSDFFKALFFNGCKESQQTEITLQEVDPDTFHMILEIIHGELDCIKKRTLEDILRLAGQYQIGVVNKRCSEFIIKERDWYQDEMFRLASAYNLVDLQDHLLKKIDSKKDSDARLIKSSKDMSDSFIAKMIRKVYE